MSYLESTEGVLSDALVQPTDIAWDTSEDRYYSTLENGGDVVAQVPGSNMGPMETWAFMFVMAIPVVVIVGWLRAMARLRARTQKENADAR